MKRLVVLLGLAALAAGCGGSGVSAPKENVGVFMTRILREEIHGQWAQQWSELHPGHQRLITRARYVACSRELGTNIATGAEVFRVLEVQDDPIHVRMSRAPWIFGGGAGVTIRH